jgi:hypothetical protein
MTANPSLKELALNVLKKRATTRDSRGTVAEKLSQTAKPLGTMKTESTQAFNPTVPLSHALGTGTLGHPSKTGTVLGTLVGQSKNIPFAATLVELAKCCPAFVPEDRWRQCIEDGRRFLAEWGEHAQALGWTSNELVGLHDPPAKAPNYSRLSRYDCRGLLWSLQGQTVKALTAEIAAISTPSGGTVVYRKLRKPALGPLGDSLDDFV